MAIKGKHDLITAAIQQDRTGRGEGSGGGWTPGAILVAEVEINMIVTSGVQEQTESLLKTTTIVAIFIYHQYLNIIISVSIMSLHLITICISYTELCCKQSSKEHMNPVLEVRIIISDYNYII